MNVLAVDTSTNSACLGLFQVADKKVTQTFYEADWNKQRSHSEVITSHFNSAISEANINPADIDLVVLGVGPGSFTGIRVALNFCKALAYSYNIDVYTTNSLLPIAVKYQEHSDKIVVINNAFRNMVYGLTVNFKPELKQSEPFACHPQDLHKHIGSDFLKDRPLLLGDAIQLYKSSINETFLNSCQLLSDEPIEKCSHSLLKVFLQDKGPEFIHWNQVLPLYIRGSEAEEKLKLNK